MRFRLERWLHQRSGEFVVLDNRDSFTFNLVHRLYEAGAKELVVVRSDEISVEELAAWEPCALVISPGPGHPDDAGISVAAVRAFTGHLPILGVCLGHQAIARAFGIAVSESGRPKHGMASEISHTQSELFSGIEQGALMGRYHSLVAHEILPPLRETARFGELNMGVEHESHPTFGVQFHPESVLSPSGLRLLQNFVEIARKHALSE